MHHVRQKTLKGILLQKNNQQQGEVIKADYFPAATCLNMLNSQNIHTLTIFKNIFIHLQLHIPAICFFLFFSLYKQVLILKKRLFFCLFQFFSVHGSREGTHVSVLSLSLSLKTLPIKYMLVTVITYSITSLPLSLFLNLCLIQSIDTPSIIQILVTFIPLCYCS